MSNGKDTEPSLQRSLLATLDHTEFAEEQENSGYFIVPVLNIRICKALIPLKLALFVWYGAVSTILTFITLFYKQRGITLSELSTVHTISPLLQLLYITICGIIADKIGRAKPVLVVNVLFVVVITYCMQIAPSLNAVKCDTELVALNCYTLESGQFMGETNCDVTNGVVELRSCKVRHTENTIQRCDGTNKTVVSEINCHILKDITELTTCNISYYHDTSQHCDGENLVCGILEEKKESTNLSPSISVRWMYNSNNTCLYNFSSMCHKNIAHPLCGIMSQSNITCLVSGIKDCLAINSGRNGILIINAIIIVLFYAVMSVIYRFLDVTTMILIKEHNSDFGLHRAFSMVGILVFSALIGFIVDRTSTDGSDKNYAAVLYIFIAMDFLLLVILYKVEIHIRPPGKHLWRNAVPLIKNFDVICFTVVLLVLGTSFMFVRLFRFWYLEGLNASSFLLGLINSANSLYGLPFLLTSHMWVKKIGTTQIFLLGLLGYVANGVGYFLLFNPWMALLVETSNIFTYHLLWVAVVIHSHEIAPRELTTTVIAVAGGIHYNLGTITASLIGGLIMNAFGGRIAFGVLAAICFTTFVFYAIYIYSRKIRSSRNKSTKLRGGSNNTNCENEDKTVDTFVMKTV